MWYLYEKLKQEVYNNWQRIFLLLTDINICVVGLNQCYVGLETIPTLNKKGIRVKDMRCVNLFIIYLYFCICMYKCCDMNYLWQLFPNCHPLYWHLELIKKDWSTADVTLTQKHVFYLLTTRELHHRTSKVVILKMLVV